MFFLEEFVFFVSDDIKYNKTSVWGQKHYLVLFKNSASAFVTNGRRYTQVHL